LAVSNRKRHAYLPFGLVFGAGIGLLFGLVTGNLAIGLALGAGTGLVWSLVIGQALARRRDE